MYAIIQSGGKQYRVTEGDLLNLERLDGEVGQEVSFDEVLLVGRDDSVQVGQPRLEGAQVMGTIVEHGKGAKTLVFKFKRRKMYRRKRGHRQLFTQVQIGKIALASKKSESKKAAPKKAAPKKAAPKKAASKPKTSAAAKTKKAGSGKSKSTAATKKTSPAKPRARKSTPAEAKED